MPYISLAENATIVENELIHTLKHLAPASNFTNIGDDQIAALTEVADIFGKITKSHRNTRKLKKNSENREYTHTAYTSHLKFTLPSPRHRPIPRNHINH